YRSRSRRCGAAHLIRPSGTQETPMTKRILAPLALALLLPSVALAQSADEVVATVGESNITRGELEKSVKSQLIEIDNQRYEVLEDGLNNIVSEKLLSLEAQAQGKSVEDFQKELMQASVVEPSDEI